MNPVVVLVTGAAGFAGSHLVEHLNSCGIHAVGWDRRQVDLLDRDTVRASMRQLRPAAIYHCAGAPHVASSWDNTTATLATNVRATDNLLDAVRRAGQPCRVLLTGSAMVYASTEEALTEDHRLMPSSPYGLSKLAQERLGRRSLVEDGIDVVLTRSFNHTGPRQDPSFAASGFARQLALIETGLAEPVLRVGNLEARRDLTDVRDTVRAYRLLLECGRPGEVYNVCSGIAYAVHEIVDGLLRRVTVPVRNEIDPARLRPSDTPVLLGSPARLRSTTGWTPEISFDRMLDDLLEYWRAAVRLV